MEQDDLMKNVRDFFINQYNIKNNTSKTFLAFEPLAHMLSADDFKFNGVFNPEIAADELSRMTDKIPEVNDVFIADGTRTLSGTYGEMVASLQFTDKSIVGDKSPYIGKFANIKSAADFSYENGARASTENGPSERIYLTRGTPSGWYDVNSSIWPRNTITQSTTTTTQTGPKQPAILNSRIIWKSAPAASKISQNTTILNMVKNPALVNKINLAAQNTKLQMNPGIGTIKTKTTAMPAAFAFSGAGTALASPTLASAAPAAAPMLFVNKVPLIDKRLYSAMNISVSFLQKVLLNRTVGRLDNAQTQEVKSTKFQMDFSYALVTLERSWLSADVIDNAKLWYALAHKSGYYSSGEVSADNKGAMRSIPKAMIVVKDLSITAQWSEEDRKAAETALGFGSFNVSNSYFSTTNKNQLLAPGVMILGWVCEVLPKLPLNDDVNVN